MMLRPILAQYRPVTEPALQLTAREPQPLLALDPATLAVDLAAGSSAHLVVVHRNPSAAQIRCRVGEGARLELTHLFLAGASAEVEVAQAAQSRCRITTLQLHGATASYRIDLAGHDAENELYGAFVAGGAEHCTMQVRTSHLVADCRSNSTVKGVAGGEAVGNFSGLVYVATDAQRTDARQQSRNILLSPAARIDAKPQLEIYADDVKCTHGATVGQLSDEAVLYMRQRGLDEQQARRVQVEGFVGDVAAHCSEEPLVGAILGLIAAKMEQL